MATIYRAYIGAYLGFKASVYFSLKVYHYMCNIFISCYAYTSKWHVHGLILFNAVSEMLYKQRSIFTKIFRRHVHFETHV